MGTKRLFCISLVAFFIVSTSVPRSGASSPDYPIIYVDPPWNSAPPGTYFTVNISVAEAMNLNSWFFKLYTKKTTLYTNESMIKEGPFLSSVGTTVFTVTEDGIYWNVGCHIQGDVGTSGNGTLATITFLVQQGGDSNLALIETKLRDPGGVLINHAKRLINHTSGYFNSEKVEAVSEVTVGEKNFTIVTTTNSSVYPVPFNVDTALKEISFNVMSPNGMTGYCNVSIPKPFMNCTSLDEWVVKVDGDPAAYFPTPTENATHTFVYFTYTTSTREVSISSTYMIPEFPLIIILQLLIIATLVAAMLAKRFVQSI